MSHNIPNEVLTWHAQLLVAMEVPLHRIPDVRRLFGRDPDGSDLIDFDDDVAPWPRGHVIAVRVTSEDPDDGFRPTTGHIQASLSEMLMNNEINYAISKLSD